jgi:N-acetyl-1-D-myo-inositol-2-amino-2-deoxy-alpha-D-glucopyranoside deacetylase
VAGGLAAAVPAALFAALAGTALHRQEFAATGAAVPLGAVAALLLLASLQLFLGAAFRTLVPTAVCGALCYALAGWWSGMESGKRLIAGDLAGSIWVYGIVVVTVAMLAWCRRYRRQSAQGTVPSQPSDPGGGRS